MTRHPILAAYDTLRAEGKKAFLSEDADEAVDRIERLCREYLETVDLVELDSQVDGKTYVAFTEESEPPSSVTPINVDLFDESGEAWQRVREAMKEGDLTTLTPEEITEGLYSTAISFCSCVDLIRPSQKTRGTFFEYYAAYFFSWQAGVEPKKSTPVLSLGEGGAELPTDNVFDLGERKPKFHMPVKTSTRERAIMLWAHQKLLDGVYGLERFQGIPILLAETKTGSSTREVIEICTPEQWLLYQTYIARLKCIYYLDMPRAYESLNWEYPQLPVRPLGHFFHDWEDFVPTKPEGEG